MSESALYILPEVQGVRLRRAEAHDLIRRRVDAVGPAPQTAAIEYANTSALARDQPAFLQVLQHAMVAPARLTLSICTMKSCVMDNSSVSVRIARYKEQRASRSTSVLCALTAAVALTFAKNACVCLQREGCQPTPTTYLKPAIPRGAPWP